MHIILWKNLNWFILSFYNLDNFIFTFSYSLKWWISVLKNISRSDNTENNVLYLGFGCFIYRK